MYMFKYKNSSEKKKNYKNNGTAGGADCGVYNFPARRFFIYIVEKVMFMKMMCTYAYITSLCTISENVNYFHSKSASNPNPVYIYACT